MLTTFPSRRLVHTSFILLIALILPAASASAQETPYSPKQVPRSQLIDSGEFQRSPIQLPWTAVRITTASNSHGSLNFEHLLNESYETVLEHFTNGYQTQQPVVSLATEVMRYSKTTELKVLGIDANASSSRVTLGSNNLPRHFLINIERAGNQTNIIVINSAHTMEYSGVMPARTPLRPVGAKPISFRWN